MTRSSCITHSTRQQLVLIRQDYLEICNGDHCAAALLNVFEYWTNVKLSAAEQAKIDNEIAQYEGLAPTQDTELWFYKRVPDFQAELLDLFGEKKVATGLQFLKDNGFIQTRNNPKYKWDKTLQYLLNIDALNCALRDRKNAVSKKSKRALNTSQNAVAIPKTTTKTTTKNSPKPPKGAVKPAKYPTVFSPIKWSNELIAQFSDEYAEGLTALIDACDMGEMYPTIKNMPRRDALKYMEALLELTRLGCPHGQFHSLWIYTRTVLNWRRNAISPLDMVEQYTAWRQSRETELTAPLPLGMKEIR